ncbi:MAG: biotin synthase BioB [Candidatus Margulisiibacteriota bacterium]
MKPEFYQTLTQKSLAGETFSAETCLEILTSPDIDLMDLIQAAYQVRKHHWGKEVAIHIINNAQNGYCPEDCHYCAQAKTSKADIEEYPLKSEAEIMAEAKNAYESGAFRYCMVFAGRGPSKKRVQDLSALIRKIKAEYPIQICVSAGLMDEEATRQLKEAGLDRMNHNLNTSEANYPNICTTHTYEDRLKTLKAAQKFNLDICSGMIIGMGESPADVVEVLQTLATLKSKSIPINFFMKIPGTQLTDYPDLTPNYCLRVLCLARFLNPAAEIRAAAGREIHLGQLQVLSLYPANSIFMDGYLNTKGSNTEQTLRMIQDAGFTIASDHSINDILGKTAEAPAAAGTSEGSKLILKQLRDLRPQLKQS